MVKRHPIMRYPYNLERSYQKNINRELSLLDKMTNEVLKKKLQPLVETRQDDERPDFSFTKVKKTVDILKLLLIKVFPEMASKRIAKKFVNSVVNYNKEAIDTQLNARDMSPIKSEAWIKSIAETKTAENVAYIQGIASDYTQKVEEAVLRTVSSGDNFAELSDQIQKISDKSRNQADFIARDQVGSLLGQINAERQKRAGFPAFRWSDSGDNRVRPSHAEKNGKIYFYDHNPLIPGEEYACRCVAEPVDEEELEEITGEQDYTKSSIYKTSSLIAEAEKHESNVTEDLKDIAENVDGKLVGLKYRLKSYESLQRKVENNGENKQIRDVLRYTFESSSDKYVSTYNKVIDGLVNKSYNVSVVKNYWEDTSNPYNGLNLFIKTDDGYEFELQFHTKESFALKNGKLHELYEKARVLDQLSEEVTELNDKMMKLSKELEFPANVSKIKDVK